MLFTSFRNEYSSVAIPPERKLALHKNIKFIGPEKFHFPSEKNPLTLSTNRKTQTNLSKVRRISEM